MAAKEIVSVALPAIGRAWPTALVFAVCFGVLLLLEGRLRIPRPWRGRLYHLLLLGGASYGIAKAWEILWLADDAFVSFRYARNWARGWGLVYNEGEWVEGYTNFLWTLLLGVLGRLGFDIPLSALFGNLACFVAALAAVGWAVRRFSPSAPLVPFAVLALALSKPFYTFAGSGLETMPLALLAALAMACSGGRRGPFLAGLCLTASVMCRPDQALLLASMGCALVGEDLLAGEGPFWRRWRPWRYASFLAPFVFLYVPYFLLRWKAYGEPLPNTFYVKSGGGAYWSQGIVYLTHFFSSSGAWLWFPLFFVSIFGRRRDRDELRLRLFALLAVLLLGTYVVRVGGDFMEYRFFVPLLPIVAVATEVSLRWRMGSAAPAFRWGAGMLAAASMAFAWIPIRLILPFEIRWHLAAEETFYQVQSLRPLRIANGHFDAGKWLGEVFGGRGLSPRMAGGSIGMVGYYADLPLFDVMGLTSRRIAHKKMQGRSRPGHEKRATLEEILEDGVVIDLNPVWGLRWSDSTRGVVDGRMFHFFRYDPELVAKLSGEAGAVLPDPEKDVASLLSEGGREDWIEALAFYSNFLGGWEERGRLLGLLEQGLASVAEFEKVVPREARQEGRALRILSGEPPRGASGRGWLSSVGREGLGSLTIPVPIASRELRFSLGGFSTERVGVELRVGGEVVRRAAPSGAPGLSPVAWDVGPWQGAEAELVIFDRDARPSVGVEVDGIHFDAGEMDIRRRIAAGLGPRGAYLREAELVLPQGDPDLQRLYARIEERFTFDDGLPEGSHVEGKAFSREPAPGSLPGQGPVHGARGPGLLNSFRSGDRGRGKVLLPERTLSGGPIHFLVGGSADCRRVHVALEVEGKVVERACGKEDEVLRPASFETARWKGKKGRILVVDDSSEGWGHIVVDDVVFEGG